MHDINDLIVDECQRLQRSVQNVSDKYAGPIPKSDIKSTSLPFVLLLGNHSSGKSSFINHLIQRKVQATGVAPTDDNFTVIGSGDADIDRDGPAFLGDPSLGFEGLQQFGPMLMHRTQLKVRTDLALRNILLVDSPGMIDSPVMRDQHGNRKYVEMDRGYDFEGVCRWYAERADVILLFFDPDKPGTTGETLSILTNSLKGLDHKLHIILNKADQFQNIHDFARSYGCLCWNLSKVIHRKDLPKIHTISLPSPSSTGGGGMSSSNNTAMMSYGSGDAYSPYSQYNNTSGNTANTRVENNYSLMANPSYNKLTMSSVFNNNNSNKKLSIPEMDDHPSYFMRKFFDLESSRIEVVSEVYNAPNRRVDHEISRLTENIHTTLMHCKVVDVLAASHTQNRIKQYVYYALSCTGYAVCMANSKVIFRLLKGRVSGLSTSHSGNTTLPSYYYIGSALFGLAGLWGMYVWQDYTIKENMSELLSLPHLETVYGRLYATDIVNKNEFISSLWTRVSTHIQSIAHNLNLSNISRVKREDIQLLENVLEKDIPNLRKQAVHSILQQKSGLEITTESSLTVRSRE